MSQEVSGIYINGAELLVFLHAVDCPTKHDILASTLYSQLAADKQNHKFTNYASWHGTLLKALATFGWLRLELKGDEGEWLKSDTFTPVDIFSALLPKILEGWRGKKLEEMLNLLFSAPLSDQASALRDRSIWTADNISSPACADATTASTALMQLGFVLPSGEKVSLCVAFETIEAIGENPFTQSFSRQQLLGEIKSFALIGKLDELRYSQFRHKINEALNERRDELSLIVEGHGL